MAGVINGRIIFIQFPESISQEFPAVNDYGVMGTGENIKNGSLGAEELNLNVQEFTETGACGQYFMCSLILGTHLFCAISRVGVPADHSVDCNVHKQGDTWYKFQTEGQTCHAFCIN